MTHQPTKLMQTALYLVTAALAAPGVAQAQSVLLDEIIVTAQKREQSAQDVGIAITTLSGQQMEQLGYTSTADIIAQTPSMRMLSFSPSLTVFNIRGVSQNDFADHYEPPVAVFVDEAYISTQGAVNSLMYDMERVEVLHGPQGTLFGRNATGGAVQYITRKPGEELDGYARLTIGEYEQRNIEAAIGGPLSDTVMARASVSYVNNDGWINNRIGEDLNKNEDISGRLQVLLKAGDNTDILIKVHGTKNDDTSGGYSHSALFPNADGLGTVVPPNVNYYGTCGGCDLLGYRNSAGDDVWDQAHDRIGFLDREIYGVTAKITSDLGFATLTSISDYLTMEKKFGSDSDASPNDLLTFDTDQSFDQYSQELRLSGESDRFRWVGGLYFLYIDTDNMAAAGIGTLFVPKFVSTADYTLTTKSAAVFGQLEYDLSDTVTAIAGVRLTTDTKKMNYRLTDNFGSLVEFNTSLYPDLAKKTFENVSAKLQLNWRPQEDWLLYASINRGTKAGSFSAPIFQPFNFADLPHGQEVLTSFEVGSKSQWADGRVRFNAAAFYYDYNNYQAFFLAGLSQSIANRDAKVFGFEADLTASPVEGLELSVGVSHLDGEVKDVTLPAGRVADRDMPMSPGLSLTWLARYSFPVPTGRLALQVDGNHTSSFYFYVVNPPQAKEPSHTVTNARISYTTEDERWELALAVKNLTNEKYRLYTNDISALSIGLDAFAPPRWVSGSLTYRFN